MPSSLDLDYHVDWAAALDALGPSDDELPELCVATRVHVNAAFGAYHRVLTRKDLAIVLRAGIDIEDAARVTRGSGDPRHGHRSPTKRSDEQHARRLISQGIRKQQLIGLRNKACTTT